MSGAARFCAFCGAPVARDVAFCGSCGRQTAGFEPAAYAPPPAAGSAPGAGRPGLLTFAAFGCAAVAAAVAIGAVIVAWMAVSRGQGVIPASGATPSTTVAAATAITLATATPIVQVMVLTATPTATPVVPQVIVVTATPAGTAAAPAPTVTAAPPTPMVTAAPPTPTVTAALPTPTPSPTRTPVPTATIGPTSTPLPTIEPFTGIGASLFTDGMASNSTGWSEQSSNDYKTYLYNHQFHTVITAANRTIMSTPGKYMNLGNFLFSADVKYEEGPTDGGFGIIFREQGQVDYCFYMISANGYWKLTKMVRGVVSTLVPWTPSPNIDKGISTNHLEVLAVGSKFSFFINGGKVGAFTDTSFPSGSFGLAATTGSVGGLHATFDSLSINDWVTSGARDVAPWLAAVSFKGSF